MHGKRLVYTFFQNHKVDCIHVFNFSIQCTLFKCKMDNATKILFSGCSISLQVKFVGLILVQTRCNLLLKRNGKCVTVKSNRAFNLRYFSIKWAIPGLLFFFLLFIVVFATVISSVNSKYVRCFLFFADD